MPLIQETIFSTLVAAATDAGANVFPLRAPDNQQPPYIIYQRVSNAPETVMNQNAQVLEQTRFQIDSFAATYAGAQNLANQVQAAMAAAAFKNVPISEQDLDEPEVKQFRVLQEYSVWS